MKIALDFFDRKDGRGLRLWLEKPAIYWMQHIDTKERIIIWAAFDFPDLSGFRITTHSSEWKDGISLLRRTSFQSGAPWCTEPLLGSLPRPTTLCSMPVTSRRGNTTPHTYRWLPTQVSQTFTRFLFHINVATGMVLIQHFSLFLKADGCFHFFS